MFPLPKAPKKRTRKYDTLSKLFRQKRTCRANKYPARMKCVIHKKTSMPIFTTQSQGIYAPVDGVAIVVPVAPIEAAPVAPIEAAPVDGVAIVVPVAPIEAAPVNVVAIVPVAPIEAVVPKEVASVNVSSLSLIPTAKSYIGESGQYQRLQNWIQSRVNNLRLSESVCLLRGPPGCGKTMMIDEIAKKLGVDVQTYGPGDLINSRVHANNSLTRAIFGRGFRKRIVVIDAFEYIAQSPSMIHEIITKIVCKMHGVRAGKALVQPQPSHPVILVGGLEYDPVWMRFKRKSIEITLNPLVDYKMQKILSSHMTISSRNRKFIYMANGDARLMLQQAKWGSLYDKEITTIKDTKKDAEPSLILSDHIGNPACVTYALGKLRSPSSTRLEVSRILEESPMFKLMWAHFHNMHSSTSYHEKSYSDNEIKMMGESCDALSVMDAYKSDILAPTMLRKSTMACQPIKKKQFPPKHGSPCGVVMPTFKESMSLSCAIRGQTSSQLMEEMYVMGWNGIVDITNGGLSDSLIKVCSNGKSSFFTKSRGTNVFDLAEQSYTAQEISTLHLPFAQVSANLARMN